MIFIKLTFERVEITSVFHFAPGIEPQNAVTCLIFAVGVRMLSRKQSHRKSAVFGTLMMETVSTRQIGFGFVRGKSKTFSMNINLSLVPAPA